MNGCARVLLEKVATETGTSYGSYNLPRKQENGKPPDAACAKGLM
jgi:hypothetical protein